MCTDIVSCIHLININFSSFVLQETIPLGAINVTKYTVQKLINFSRPNTFLITRKEGKTIYFSVEFVEDFDSWISLISSNAKHQVKIYIYT